MAALFPAVELSGYIGFPIKFRGLRYDFLKKVSKFQFQNFKKTKNIEIEVEIEINLKIKKSNFQFQY
jgi:hypothetical protein